MGKGNRILIADRNPRIRGFLKRELASCGYHIRLVENGKELLKLIFSRTPIDLLVMDPNFPGVEAIEMARNIVDRIPQLPVVLFCTRGHDDFSDYNVENVFIVEKNGQSIEVLKETIQTILSGDHLDSSVQRQG